LKTRFRWLCATAATALLGLAGCIQTEDSTTLLSDGSGTSSSSMAFDLEKMKQLMEMAKAMSGGMGEEGGEAPDLSTIFDTAFSEEALKGQLKDAPGVEIKSLKSEVLEGQRVVKMDIAFSDFASLGKAGFQQTGMELKKNDDGSWTLVFEGMGGGGFGGMGGPPAGGGEGAPEGMPPGMDMGAMMGMLEPYLGTMSVKRKIVLPGTVVSTNGKKVDDKTVEWSFGFKDMTAPATDGKGPGYMTVTFRGDDLTLKPFVFKADPAAMQKRLSEGMKPAPKGPVTPGEKPADAPKAAPGDPGDPVGVWVIDVDAMVSQAVEKAKQQLAELPEEQRKAAEGFMNPEAMGAMMKSMLGAMKLEVDLKADNTAAMSVSGVPGQEAEVAAGTWEAKDGKIVVTLATKNGQPVTEESDKKPGVFQMQDGKLVMLDDDGEQMVLRRK
jgi:hypothetical protein